MSDLLAMHAAIQAEKQTIFLRSMALKLSVSDDIVLVKRLGEGAFGQVWSGTRGGDEVVVKISNLTADENAVYAFLIEAVMHSLIKETDQSKELCKDVVACALDMFISPSLDGVIVFPFQTPRTLLQFISDAKSLKQSVDGAIMKAGLGSSSQEEALRPIYETLNHLFIILDLIRDVKRLHAAGIAHLDLKPDNILVTDPLKEISAALNAKKRETVIIDLGLACADPKLLMQHKDTIKKTKSRLLDSLAKNTPSRLKGFTTRRPDAARAKIIRTAIENADMADALACQVNRGTKEYVSPGILKEPYQFLTQSLLEDCYALGIIMFEMLRRKLLRNDPMLRLNTFSFQDAPAEVSKYVLKFLQNQIVISSELADVITMLMVYKKTNNPVTLLQNAENTVARLVETNIAAAKDIVLQ